MSRHDTDAVREQARGRWPEVLATLAPELRDAIDRGHHKHVPCPVHGGRDGLRVFDNFAETGGMVCNTCGTFSDGFAVLKWANRWDFKEALAAVADYLGMGNGIARSALRPPSAQTPAKDNEADEATRRANPTKTWKETRKDPGRVAAYLRSRGLSGDVAAVLRYHPALDYYEPDPDDPKKMRLAGTYPAMVARVQDVAGENVNLHRTYFDPDGDGKAAVPSPKKLMKAVVDGATRGAAIHLAEPCGDLLALTEGVETGLAVQEATGTPPWACVSAGGLEAVQLPPTVRRVEVWADSDASETGQLAAEKAAARLTAEGRQVFVILPPPLHAEGGKGTDWLDVLNVQGPEALRDAQRDAEVWTPEVVAVDHTKSEPVGVLLSDVEPESLTWLWEGYIPLGKITLVDGDPGRGKSTLTLDIAARVTRGRPMPDGSTDGEPAGAVILSAEDDLADTIRPRLDAAGADCTRAVALPVVRDADGGERPPSIPDDLDRIREAIERVGARLVIVDPLMAYLGGNVNAHKDQDVRRALHRLKLLAEETGVAVLVVRHLNKAAGGSPLYRGGGSIGIIGAARAAFLVADHPEDENRRVFAPLKFNLGPEPSSLAFHVEGVEGGGCRIAWDGRTDHKAAGLLALPRTEEERTERDEAKDFLRDTLAAGPVPARDVQAEAKRSGISDATLRRARNDLGVVLTRDGFQGRSLWSLPPILAHQTHTCSAPQGEQEWPSVSRCGEAQPAAWRDQPHPQPEAFTTSPAAGEQLNDPLAWWREEYPDVREVEI